MQSAPRDHTLSPSVSSGGSVGMVMVVALSLVGAIIAMLFIGRENAQPFVLGLLAFLAVIGVFASFAVASGIIGFVYTDRRDALVRAVLEGASEGVVVTEQDGRVLMANRLYQELSRAQTLDQVRPVERLFAGDPEVSESIYRLAQAAREGRRLQEEVRIPHPEGGVARWYRLKVRPLAEQDSRTVWTVHDLTRERERQENAFQELQHAIDYLDHAPAGFFSTDSSGRLIYLNATLAGWLGYDLAQIGSRTLALGDIMSGDGASLLSLHPGRSGEVRNEVIDIDLKTRTGQAFPVRLLHKVAYGADGVPGASRTLVVNRAREMNGADSLRAAEVRFARFFHNTPLGIATIDQMGCISRSNATFARLFGGMLLAEEKSILSVVASNDQPALAEALKAALHGQGDIPPVDAVLAGNGQRSARFFVSAVSEDDRDESAIIYVLETTEQRTLQAQFAQSQKMQAVGQLAGGIAHDFNNVLSAIILATDFLLGSHKPTDPSFNDINQIRQNANRAASLVRQLLAFSRRQTLRPQVLSLSDVLSDITMLLRRLIGEKVSLDVQHGRDVWPIRADLSQFEQVIVNMAVNARDAMPNGGRLTITTGNVLASEVSALGYKGLKSQDYVRITVADTGTGIPAGILDKIFEPFYSTKEVGKGTGLGLSTVYGIVKQTDGYIYVDSTVGEGTQFSVFLPRHVPSQQELEQAALEAQATPARTSVSQADLTGQGTILLVEDEDGLRSLNSRGLESRGYTVLTAANGLEALEIFDSHKGEVDLVVSDVVMPEMDGPTLLRELRARRPGLKIVFVSGYAEDAFEKNLPEGEQFAFLPKPFALKQLVATVKETLGARS